LSEDASHPFQESESAARELSAYARQVGEDINALFMEEGRTDQFTHNEILTTMAKTTSRFFESSGQDVDSITTFSSKLRSIVSQLENMTALSSDLTKTQEFERHPAPWLLRAQALKSSKTVSPDTEEEIRRLKAELQERSTTLGIRDQTLEENNIKIELLESRIRDANKKSTLIADLEAQLEAARKREKDLSDAIEGQMRELQALELDRDNYKRRVKERPLSIAEDAVNLPLPQDHASVVVANKTIESLRLEITSLQSTIRFLQDDNQRLKFSDPDSTEININAWLNEPLVARKLPKEQEKRRQTAKAECQDILSSLLKMTKEAKLVELKAPAVSKEGKPSVWKPTKETSRWQTLRMREEWEDWRQWRDEVVKRETGWEGRIGMNGNLAASKRPSRKATKVAEVVEDKVKIVE